MNIHFPSVSNHLKTNVTCWSSLTFGDVFKNKKILLARIYGIRNFGAYPHNFFLQQLERDIIRDYNNILQIEEDHWIMRSRINWLNHGDANTKFSHLSFLNRRRRNKISFFKYDVVNWINDHKQITQNDLCYFQQIYSRDHPYTNLQGIYGSTKSFHKLDLSTLDNLSTTNR